MTPQCEGEASGVMGEAVAGLVCFTKSALMLATIVATPVTALFGDCTRGGNGCTLF